jgi:hypothetical protein
MNLLTIDDSYGCMPESVPNESIPHLLRAWNERPDAAGPIVWLYPFDELHDAMFGDNPSPERLFHNDWCVREMLNDGLPVNTVISTRAFTALGRRALEVLAERILLAPTPLNTEAEKQLLTWVDGGGDILLYGPLDAAPVLRERLGLTAAEPLSGPIDVVCDLPLLDEFQTGEAARTFEHRPLMSGGCLTESPLPGHQPSTVAVRYGEQRALASGFQTAAGGRARWLRAPLPLTMNKGDHLPAPDNQASIFSFTELARQVLGDWGWQIGVHAMSREQRRPVLTLHRHDNGWFFSGYMPDTTVEISLGTPFGAPLLVGQETWIKNGKSSYRQARGWRSECRVFVAQADGWIQHTEELPGQIGVTRRLWVRGLKNATLRFFPPTGSGPTTLWLNPEWPFIGGKNVPLREIHSPHGLLLETTRSIDGTALLSWK